MTYLLDVNTVLALLWATHSHHQRAQAWAKRKALALCPISELGFLRISSNPRGFGIPMNQARALLEEFCRKAQPTFVADSISARAISTDSFKTITDDYLAALAHKHGMLLATFDGGIRHQAVELIP
jgi:predicted nucleic acid-binding protein